MNYDWRQYIDNYGRETEEEETEDQAALAAQAASRASQIQTMTPEQRSQSQVEGRTPTPDLQQGFATGTLPLGGSLAGSLSSVLGGTSPLVLAGKLSPYAALIGLGTQTLPIAENALKSAAASGIFTNPGQALTNWYNQAKANISVKDYQEALADSYGDMTGDTTVDPPTSVKDYQEALAEAYGNMTGNTTPQDPQKIMDQNAINAIGGAAIGANLGLLNDAYQRTISTPQQDLNEAFPDSTPIDTPVDTPIDTPIDTPTDIPTDIPQNPAEVQADAQAQAEATQAELDKQTTTGGGNETPPETPDGKPPKNWKTAAKYGIYGAGALSGLGLGGAMLDNAAGNALEDGADPFDVYNTLGGITDQELPDFLGQTPDEIYTQTEADILENLQNQQIGLGESYSDLYARALQSAYRREASATSPYTNVAGGQPAQTEEGLTASAINQLNQIATNYEAQQRDIENMRLAAPQEARAAALEQLSVIQNLTDRSRGEAVQIMSIVMDPQYSDEQRGYLMREFGLSDEEVNQILGLEKVDNRFLGNIRDWLESLRQNAADEDGFWAGLNRLMLGSAEEGD